MSMAKCRECGKEVSSEAETCPHCGIKKPVKPTASSAQIGCLSIIVLVALVSIFMPSGDSKPVVDDATCKKDLSCWGDKHISSAVGNCKEPIEKLANYTVRWTDGTLDMKFSQFRWKDQQQGVVTYIGDKIEFQNGFGAWQGHVYECDIDPVSNVVYDVRAKPGRL